MKDRKELGMGVHSGLRNTMDGRRHDGVSRVDGGSSEEEEIWRGIYGLQYSGTSTSTSQYVYHPL